MKTQKCIFLLSIIFCIGSCCKEDDGNFADYQEDSLTSEELLNVVEITKDIEDDLRLENIVADPGKADYVITDWIVVEKMLTIDPGVVIAFNANAGLSIGSTIHDGVLVAKGTESEPIIFTGTSKTKGFWKGIRVTTNDVRNEMDHVTVEFAGSDKIVSSIKNGVRAAVALNYETSDYVGSLKMTNSTIRESDGYGLVLEDERCQLRSFGNNSFKNNTNASVLVTPPTVAYLDAGSSYSGNNGYDGVEIAADCCNAIEENAIWSAFDDGSSYYVSGSVEVKARLTIMAGARFEFEANQEMRVFEGFTGTDGEIIALGTAEKPIIFTGKEKVPGYWKGLRVQSDSSLNELYECIVEYGGSDNITGIGRANVGLDRDGPYAPPRLKITKSVLSNSAGCAIAIDDPLEAILVTDQNTYIDNQGGDICL